MPLLLGIDLGTTKLTSIAFDTDAGDVVGRSAVPNDANITTPADVARGRSEWNADRIVDQAFECLRQTTAALGERSLEIVALGITGQQHGTVIVDDRMQPLTPLINWQDRRGGDAHPSGRGAYVDVARSRLGEDAIARCGCRLQSGFLATTLFWLRETKSLPRMGRACFIMDLFAARLARGALAIEPSAAGSSGVFSPRTRQWDPAAIDALELNPTWFPPVAEARDPLNRIDATRARALGLPERLSIFPALGDHQSSYLGSVADRSTDLLVNVGTGAQVAAFSSGLDFAPPVELRPFPFAGNLLSNVGLPGGWSYQLLEQFFAHAGRDVLGVPVGQSLYPALNRLAREVPSGAGGLRCEPTFAGTRSDAAIRGVFSGISPQNFTPAHFARALLEGMAAGLHRGFQTIRKQHPGFRPARLVAAGNGLRENLLLAELTAREFGLPMVSTVFCEEAAVGAALAAAVGAGVFQSLDEAGRCLRYA